MEIAQDIPSVIWYVRPFILDIPPFDISPLIVNLTSQMWFRIVCTLIDNDIRHHSEQNVVDSHGAALSESTTNFSPL